MDWTDALQQAVLEHKDAIGYGIGDCLQFVRTYVRHMTGEDHGAEFDYGLESEASNILAAEGGPAGLLSKYLGDPMTEREPEPGDIVVVHVGRELAAGVLSRGFVLCLDPERGFVKSVPENITEAWSCRSQ